MLYKSIFNNNIFIINYKCGFSTFQHLTYHEKFVQRINFDIIKENLDEYNFYIIVREPIKRFVSFYKDKFIQAPRNNIEFNENKYNLHLNNYFKNYILNDFNINKLTINLLCEMIKNKYHCEGHLVKQSDGDYKKIRENNIHINIVKMENLNFNDILCELIGIKFDILKVNNTNGIKINEELNEENYVYLKNVFDDDFKEFNY